MPCSQMISMNMRPPLARAARKVDSVPKVKARIRNSDRRNIGSGARRSIITNATRHARPPASSRMTRGLPHPVG